MKTASVLALCVLGRLAPAQTEPVEIYFDESGIAHVFGATDAAAFYGYGFHQMREYPIGTLDRLWRFSGRMSEVAGPSYLDEDYQIRLWDVPALVARDLAMLPADVLALAEAFVRGIEDGRAWWRDGQSVPSESTRLKQLFGTSSDPDHMQMNFSPLPDYFNQGFHNFQLDPDHPATIHPDYHPDDVPRYMERIADRLFSPDLPITVQHVLALTIVVNSAPGLIFTASELGSIPNDDPFTNLWVASSAATGGPVVTLTDPHTGRDKLTTRPHLVQLHGDRYKAAGVASPGMLISPGFNDHITWHLSGSSRNDALQRTTWEVPLLPTAPLAFRYGASTGPSKVAKVELGPLADWQRVRLIAVPDSIPYFDPVASRDLDLDGHMDPNEVVLGVSARTRHYVPDPDGLGFVADRYPVTKINGIKADGLDLPEPGDVIRFRQASFTTLSGHWEFLVRLGRARHLDGAPPGEDQVVDILAETRTGWDNNYVFADYQSRFYYQYLAHVPILSPSLLATLTPDDLQALEVEEKVLDGGLPSHRWQGFHPFTALPRIGPVAVDTPEVWVCSNPTPDLIEFGPNGNGTGKRFTAADLAAVPDEIMSSRSISNWRQKRALAVLSNPTPGSLAGVTESLATDVTDTRMQAMWPFFLEARDIKASELLPSDPDFAFLPDVDRFIAWVEYHRHLAPDGLTYDPAHDFEGHKYSLQTVYTGLLFSWYVNELDRLAPNELQEAFGEDSQHELLALGPSAFVRPTYTPNIDAMWRALVGGGLVQPGTVPLWKLGSAAGGLANQDLFVQSWMHPGWSADPRFADTQAVVDPLFDADMGGTRVTRWGLVNQLVVTAHTFVPGRSAFTPVGRGLAQIYTGLRPDLLMGFVTTDPVAERFKFPVYTDHTPLVFPLDGVEESVLVTRNPAVTQGNHPFGQDQALYRTSTSPSADTLYYMLHDQGSQVILSAQLFDPPSGRGRFLSASGPTELTDPFLPGQSRYGVTPDFTNRVWRDFETEQATLATTNQFHLHLDYQP